MGVETQGYSLAHPYPSRSNFCLEFPSTTAAPSPINAPHPTAQLHHLSHGELPLNPVSFLLPGFAVEPGPTDRLVRSGMVVGLIPPLNHDFLAVAEASAYVPLHRRAAIRAMIEGLLHEAQLFTTESSDHPLGIGPFGFVDSFMRDTAVNTPLELE